MVWVWYLWFCLVFILGNHCVSEDIWGSLTWRANLRRLGSTNWRKLHPTGQAVVVDGCWRFQTVMAEGSVVILPSRWCFHSKKLIYFFNFHPFWKGKRIPFWRIFSEDGVVTNHQLEYVFDHTYIYIYIIVLWSLWCFLGVTVGS